MLVRRVVHDEVRDHPEPAAVRLGDEGLEVRHLAVERGDLVEVGDVVAVVPERGRKERKEPQAVDAQILDVVQAGGEAREVADAVVVRVLERLDVHLVEDGVLVPEVIHGGVLRRRGHRRARLVRRVSVARRAVGALTEALEPEDRRGLRPGSRRTALRRPPPEVPLVREQVVGLEGLVGRDAQGLEGQRAPVASCGANGSRFTATRTAFGPVRAALPVAEDVLVVALVEDAGSGTRAARGSPGGCG